MKNNNIKFIVGILLMVLGMYNATLDIPTTWHYFGNGAIFGIGLFIVFNALRAYRKTKKSA